MSAVDSFVQLPFVTDPTALADIAIAYLQTQWPGWMPNDADQEVVQIEALAPMAANAAAVAANMPKAALIQYGVQLLQQPYGAGTPAVVTVEFTLDPAAAGGTVPAGTAIVIDGFGFSTIQDETALPGETVVDVVCASGQLTAAANGLTGLNVAPVVVPAYVIGMAVVGGASDGGSDPQTDDDYASQLSADAQLVSRALVTLLDYEQAALLIPGIGRAKAEYGTSVRHINVTVLGSDGAVVPSALKDLLVNPLYPGTLGALPGVFQDPTQRMVNAVPTVIDPDFTAADIAFELVIANGFDPNDCINRAIAALTSELNPLGWGVPDSGDPSAQITLWLNETTVHVNRLIGVVSALAGINYVPSLTINGGGDLVMTGAVALPQIGTCTGTVTGVAI
jgi:hypothetical protein